ncbi:MAG: hypothetical protein COB53_04680 [Elusimicrobia bacterium]|nr:MAG: hypothetical protein COB53_04680 [Elusimicrobiota bacterium]
MARILVVDDDVGYCGLLNELLSGEGHIIIEAMDAKEALWLLDNEFGLKPPDLIITDFNMAEINGYEFISQLRIQERYTDMPILMISGTSKKIEHLLKMNGIEYLPKSSSNSKIQSMIDSLIGSAVKPQKVEEEEEKMEEFSTISEFLPTEPLLIIKPLEKEPPPRLPTLPRTVEPSPPTNVIIPPRFGLEEPLLTAKPLEKEPPPRPPKLPRIIQPPPPANVVIPPGFPKEESNSEVLPAKPLLTAKPLEKEPPPRLPTLPRIAHQSPPVNVIIPPGFHWEDSNSTEPDDIVSRSVELTQMIEVGNDHEEKSRTQAEESIEIDDASPVARLISEFLEEAIQRKASDIHIEPQRSYVQVRVRVDGALQRLVRLPISVSERITARIKILSDLNITEKRLPQDGQFSYASPKGQKIKLRVSTLPSAFGEKVVLRLLSSNSLAVDLDTLGLSTRNRDLLKRVLQSESGLILTTGPTGSGKTTTLYTLLRTLNLPSRNIVTVEDPIEYEIDGLTQVQVNSKIGYTFEKVLRSFLRQDPNVMLIGEIRDIETAEIALKAAVTGHMVLSTLHTNDAPSAIQRLISMGLPPYLVAAATRLVIAQRLIRLLCPECKKEGSLTHEEESLLSLQEKTDLEQIYRPVGCERCHNSGYQGRRAIFEFMPVLSDRVRDLITQQASLDALAAASKKEGRESLRAEALRFLQSGRTSPEEAFPYAC